MIFSSLGITEIGERIERFHRCRPEHRELVCGPLARHEPVRPHPGGGCRHVGDLLAPGPLGPALHPEAAQASQLAVADPVGDALLHPARTGPRAAQAQRVAQLLHHTAVSLIGRSYKLPSGEAAHPFVIIFV